MTIARASALAGLLLFTGAVAADEPPLPPAWHGTWAGTLVISGVAGGRQEVPLTLTVAPIPGTAELTWRLTYDDKGKKLVKDYKLVPDPVATSRFKIDERNGIALPARLEKGVIYSQFAVGKNVLAARYDLRGDAIRFEVTSARPVGDAGPAGVQGYEVVNIQTAELKKQPTR